MRPRWGFATHWKDASPLELRVLHGVCGVMLPVASCALAISLPTPATTESALHRRAELRVTLHCCFRSAAELSGRCGSGKRAAATRTGGRKKIMLRCAFGHRPPIADPTVKKRRCWQSWWVARFLFVFVFF